METTHAINLYGEKIAAHKFREWSGKQDRGIERFQQNILADRHRQTVRETAASWTSKEHPLSHETQRTATGPAVAPRSSIVLIVGEAS